MRSFPVACSICVLALVAAAPAAAKFKLTLAFGDSSPTVGQPITVVLRTEGVLSRADGMKLVAVAPGRSMFDVIGVVTGASSLARAVIPRDGFGIALTRVAPHRWRAFVQFPRAGSWQIVVPNWGPVGYAIPPPLVRELQVSSG
ncbi:MAG TPA: hypothetical protein VG652_03670 [Gaiellaceae bacterium]|nr:hypothetical protein [Gaiellaceae bacterium]